MSMDPRHPEQAIPRVKELYNQYLRVLDDINHCTTYNKLAGLEREGTLVVQELYIVSPRLHEALMSVARGRRQVLAKWPPYSSEKSAQGVEEVYVVPNQAETVIVEPKPRKKVISKKETTTKKKTGK